jgi:hypothetical protein
MLPRKSAGQPRVVRYFEVITPAGEVYRFPHVSLLHRFARVFGKSADIAAISATILVLIYVARLAGEELAVLDTCKQMVRQVVLS